METREPPGAVVCAPPGRWRAYVAPMAVFMGLTWMESLWPAYYPWLYVLKAVIVTGVLLASRSVWRDIRPSMRVIAPAIVVGLAVFAEWVLIEQWVRYPHLGARTAYDPFAAISSPGMRAVFLSARLYGLVVMVPVMEELFWRSFLLRYLSSADYTRVSIGTFTWAAFVGVAIGFGIAHPEWLTAVICACAYGLLLRQTRSLFACVVAHAVTNLALGIYVLSAHAWRFW